MTNHSTAIFNLDAANGGTALTTGTLYAQFNITEQSMTAADAADTTPNVGDFQLFRYEGGATTITSLLTQPTFTVQKLSQSQEISEEPRGIKHSSYSYTRWNRR